MNSYFLISICAFLSLAALCQGANDQQLSVFREESDLKFTPEELDTFCKQAQRIVEGSLINGTQAQDLRLIRELRQTFNVIKVRNIPFDVWFRDTIHKVLDKENQAFNPRKNLNDFLLIELVKTHANPDIYTGQGARKILSMGIFLHEETNTKWEEFLNSKQIFSLEKLSVFKLYPHITEFKKSNPDIFRSDLFPELNASEN